MFVTGTTTDDWNTNYFELGFNPPNWTWGNYYTTCPNCGRYIAWANYCPHCGHKIQQDPKPTLQTIIDTQQEILKKLDKLNRNQ